MGLFPFSLFLLSGPRRCPLPIQLDANNELHVRYLIVAANCRAYVYCIPTNDDDKNMVAEVARAFVPPDFFPSTALRNINAEAEDQAKTDEDLEKCQTKPGYQA